MTQHHRNTPVGLSVAANGAAPQSVCLYLVYLFGCLYHEITTRPLVGLVRVKLDGLGSSVSVLLSVHTLIASNVHAVRVHGDT